MRSDPSTVRIRTPAHRCWALTSMIWLAAVGAPTVEAQPLGAFQWQLQPFCNTVTLNVTPVGGVFELSGVDNLCGAARQSSVVGIAFLSPNGTIGFGLTTVHPGGIAVHLDAAISPTSLNGEWRDSAGNSGSFTFTLGAGTGGPLRPVPANGVALGSITAAHLAPGSIGALHINPAEIQTRITGTCPVGQYLRGVVGPKVICEPLLTPPVTTTLFDPIPSVGSNDITIGSDGLPIVAFSSSSGTIPGTLQVTKCGDSACAIEHVTTTVDDPTNNVGGDVSIAIGTDGLPVISHADFTAHALRVTKCGDAACTRGNISTNVDAFVANVGRGSSVAVPADGLPVISHLNSTNRALRVTKCSNPSCTAGTSVTVGAADSGGQDTSIGLGLDGLPVISHVDTAGGLRVTKCGSAGCTAGNIDTTISDATHVANATALAIGSDGLPVIGYLDIATSVIRVIKCNNDSCSAHTPGLAVTPPSVGQNLGIAIGTDGLPMIVFSHSPSHALRVIKCGNAACTAGNRIATAVSFAGGVSSIAVTVDGLPVISHNTDEVLKVTKCATQTCQ